MAEAIKSTTIIEPGMAEVRHITFTGDLTDAEKTVISVSLVVKDDGGDKVVDLGVNPTSIPNLNGMLTSFANSVLPKIIDEVEAELGITFQ